MSPDVEPSAGRRRAVVLLSGGLDSATVLALARDRGYECLALSFSYGQRHGVELEAAARIAEALGVREHRVVEIDLAAIGGSALTDASQPIPMSPSAGIPATYVPARNLIFLSFAVGWAEVVAAEAIFIGVNAVDYSGYPDCRQTFIEAFQQAASLGTKAGVEGDPVVIHAPLVSLSKAEIVALGNRLGVDYAKTVSCYQADAQGRACGVCDACRFRAEGFAQAGLADPTHYQR